MDHYDICKRCKWFKQGYNIRVPRANAKFVVHLHRLSPWDDVTICNVCTVDPKNITVESQIESPDFTVPTQCPYILDHLLIEDVEPDAVH